MEEGGRKEEEERKIKWKGCGLLRQAGYIQLYILALLAMWP